MLLFPSLSYPGLLCPGLLAPAALAIEAAIGYPSRLFAAIGHPVIWIGFLIARADKTFNRPHDSFARRRLSGFLVLATLLGLVFLLSSSLQIVLRHAVTPPILGFALLALCASSLLAQRSLYDHVQAVRQAVAEGGIEAGRAAVAQIVGRDVASLDEAGIYRAAVESLAENFSDGIVAPAFWLTLFGLPGICLYKSINTADSMIGHRTERHAAFGFAAAKLDDLVNWPAARLAALWLCGAAFLLSLRQPQFSAGRAIAITLRDAGGHPSPNAGWPEAAMAGALGRRLGGPRAYAGALVEDQWIGDGTAPMTGTDLCRALELYRLACLINGLALTLFWLFIARA